MWDSFIFVTITVLAWSAVLGGDPQFHHFFFLIARCENGGCRVFEPGLARLGSGWGRSWVFSTGVFETGINFGVLSVTYPDNTYRRAPGTYYPNLPSPQCHTRIHVTQCNTWYYTTFWICTRGSRVTYVVSSSPVPTRPIYPDRVPGFYT